MYKCAGRLNEVDSCHCYYDEAYLAEVEKTTIFWMSFWVRTPVAVTGVVIAPKRNAVV